MPGFVVDSTSMVSCLHQGVGALTPFPRVTVSGSPVATVPPTSPRIPVLPGCIFTVGTKPQPCVVVLWANVSARVTVLGQGLVLQASPGPGDGVCQSAEQAPQGTPTLKKLQQRVIAT
jgi:hypothetical protein